MNLLEEAHLIKDGLIDKEVNYRKEGGCLVLPIRQYMTRWELRKLFMEKNKSKNGPKKGGFLGSKGLGQCGGVQ